MQITIAAKRKNGQWRSATIADGVFSDSNISEDLTDVIANAALAAGAVTTEEGTLVTVVFTVTPASQSGPPQ